MTKPVSESEIVEKLVSKLFFDYLVPILVWQSHPLEQITVPAVAGEFELNRPEHVNLVSSF